MEVTMCGFVGFVNLKQKFEYTKEIDLLKKALSIYKKRRILQRFIFIPVQNIFCI